MVSGIPGLYPVARSIPSMSFMGGDNEKCLQTLPNVASWGRGGRKKHWLRTLAQGCMSVGKSLDLSEPDSAFVQRGRGTVRIT